MPAMCGLEVLSLLRQLALGPPVIIVTGHDTPQAREHSPCGGAAVHLLVTGHLPIVNRCPHKPLIYNA